MRYLGGKARLAKLFAPILAEALAGYEGAFVEPFVGGFNVVPALTKLDAISEAVCADVHPGLINLYRAVASGWEPPRTVTREEYETFKKNRGSDPLSAFVSFACAFGGIEWGSYACGGGRNYCDEGARSILRKLSRLPPIFFECCSYRDLPELGPAVYYCDPPYQGTTGYRTGAFDSESFFEWCEDRVRGGCRVFVSEFSAPNHWEVVWEKARKITCTTAEYKTKTDRLYEVRTR